MAGSRAEPRLREENRIVRWIYRAEDGILIGLLLTMILLSVTQILLRNLMETGLLWGDSLVRNLVLWTGLVGAMAASRTGNHIRMEAAIRYLPQRLKNVAEAATGLFTSGLCAIAAFYSLRFVLMEYAEGGRTVGSMPVWLFEAVIPLAFAVIGIRYLILALDRFRKPRGSNP
jgi:TRAP-type C4-dicarboxylate transport system permease small subunit